MTPVLTEDAMRRLPEPIVATLRLLIARIRRVMWWRGFWCTLAALITTLLAIMAVDAAFDLESNGVRAALSLAGLAAVVVVAWRTVVRPLRRPLGLAQVARLVEIHHPEMHERISTAVELLGGGESSSLRGSEELLAEVVKSAVLDVSTVTPEKEFSSRPMRWPKRLAAGALAVLAAVLALWPFQGGLLLARAVLPLANLGSASALDLRLLTRDLTVSEGDPIVLLVAAKGRAAQRPEIRRELAGTPNGPATAPPTTERLLPASSDQARPGETVFALTLPAARESFRYSAAAGRARSKTHFVEVRRRPDITGLSVSYTYPEYTGLAPKTDRGSPGDITAVPGTRVEVTATLNHPAAAATLVYDQTENAGPEVMLGSEGASPVARWAATLTTGMNYRWTLHPKAEAELLGKPFSGSLRALPDLPPDVVIDSPLDRELRLRPNEKLPILYSAADDFGLAGVELAVTLEGAASRVLAMPLPEKDPTATQTWRGTAILDLTTLPLAGVKDVRVRLRVTDTLPPSLDGPQTAVAEEIVIRLDWGADSFAQQSIRKQEEQLRRELEQVKNDLWEQRGQAGEKSDQLRQPEPMDSERLAQLQKLTERTAATAAQLAEIARKAQQSAFAPRADAIAYTATTQVQGAAESLQTIPQSDRPEDRSAAAEQAGRQLETAAREIDQILNSFQPQRQEGEELGELASLAREQQQLADQAAQAEPSSAQPSAPPENNTPAPQPAGPTAAAPAVNPLTDPTATPTQRAEAFERWQQHQDDVEHRAQNVSNQFQQKVPLDRQADLTRLAAQAQEMAQQAEALAARQKNVESLAGQNTPHSPEAAATTTTAATAVTPDPVQAAARQAEVADATTQLATAIKSLQQTSAEILKQNGKAETQAAAAAATLAQAAETSRLASEALAREALDNRTDDPPPPADPASPSPGQQAAAQTTDSLESATTALRQMARSLGSQAEGAATASQALTSATAQTQEASAAGEAAGQAGEKAAQLAREADPASPEAALAAENTARLQMLARSAATPAQQAATNLAVAAATAQAAMGLPENALGQQNMGKNGSPKPGGDQSGQGQTASPSPQPSQQPGTEAGDTAGLQTSQDYGLPPELARLGMSADDWSRLRGLINSGAESAGQDQVPAEYRDLVKSYFRALSTQASQPPAKAP